MMTIFALPRFTNYSIAKNLWLAFLYDYSTLCPVPPASGRNKELLDEKSAMTINRSMDSGLAVLNLGVSPKASMWILIPISMMERAGTPPVSALA